MRTRMRAYTYSEGKGYLEHVSAESIGKLP